MNITHDFDDVPGIDRNIVEVVFDERDYKIKPSFIIGKDIDFVGNPEPVGEGFTYKFKAISPRAIKYFSKKLLRENK